MKAKLLNNPTTPQKAIGSTVEVIKIDGSMAYISINGEQWKVYAEEIEVIPELAKAHEKLVLDICNRAIKNDGVAVLFDTEEADETHTYISYSILDSSGSMIDDGETMGYKSEQKAGQVCANMNLFAQNVMKQYLEN